MKSGEFDSSDINLKTWSSWMRERNKKGPRRPSTRRVGESLSTMSRKISVLRSSPPSPTRLIPNPGALPSVITRNSIHSSLSSGVESSLTTNVGRDSHDARSPPVSSASFRSSAGYQHDPVLSSTNDVIVVTPRRQTSMIGIPGSLRQGKTISGE
jgi:hypothetical protein